MTGFNLHCTVDDSSCISYEGDSPDSFLWHDELHPSEQLERLVAKEFVGLLGGASPYATYY